MKALQYITNKCRILLNISINIYVKFNLHEFEGNENNILTK